MANVLRRVGEEIVRDIRTGSFYKLLVPPGGEEGGDAAVYDGNSTCYRAKPPTGMTDDAVVFLKQLKSPTPTDKWFDAFVAYQKRLKNIIDRNENLKSSTYRMIDFFVDQNERKRENVYGYKYDCDQPSYWQALEWVEGGKDLKTYLEDPACTDKQRITFAKLFLYELSLFHDAGIVHSDLKPENVMLFETTAKMGYNLRIVDFDRSLIKGVEAPWKDYDGYSGTIGYFSPEHVRKERPVAASDIFTSGIMLYQLLSMEGDDYPFPYEDDFKESYIQGIQRRGEAKRPMLRIHKGRSADEYLSMIMYACLDPDPKRRPTAGDVHKALLAWDDGAVPEPKWGPGGEKGGPDPRGGALTLRTVGEDFEMSVGPLQLPPVDGFGKQMAKALFAEDARFYAGKQFGLERDREGHWYVVPNEAAANATLYNWKRVTGKTRITTGGILAVGSRNPTKNVAKGIMEVYVQGEAPIRVPRSPSW